MAFVFEELDFQQTPLGEISLRRRSEPRLDDRIVYEVKLGEEFLMSSLFTQSEIQLARLGLNALQGDALYVVVGGLGLGYTAGEALTDPRIRSLHVIEVMAPVIDWHRRELVPLDPPLSSDDRCTLVEADFFELAAAEAGGFDRSDPQRLADAVLLDIDHSPRHWLNPGNSRFYSAESLQRLSAKITAGGVFGLWSNDPPDETFTEVLGTVFRAMENHVVSFANPYSGAESACTVYIATNGRSET